MTKLSDTQRIILSQASQRDDRLSVPPERLPVAARQAVLRSMIGKGLLEEVPAPREAIALGWRQDEDGPWIALRITDAGLRAIGVDPEGEDAARTPGETAPPGGEDTARRDPTPATPAEPAQGAPVADGDGSGGEAESRPRHERYGVSDDLIYGPAEEDNGGLHSAPPPAAFPAATRRTAALRTAAERVVEAWDNAENQRATLPMTIDALRAALAPRPGRPTRAPETPRQPRSGTKQVTVLALLRRDEGATIAQVIDATGWQQHTVRGFLAGLKRKGITVEVLERIRQVGPNKQGAKGSYSIYRVAAVATAEAG